MSQFGYCSSDRDRISIPRRCCVRQSCMVPGRDQGTGEGFRSGASRVRNCILHMSDSIGVRRGLLVFGISAAVVFDHDA